MSKRFGGFLTLGVAAMGWIAPGSAGAVIVPAPTIPSLVEPDAPPKPPPTEFRANQINRCVDARGKLVLQDTPCFAPPEASAAEAGATRDLSELEPRPVKDAAANAPSASPDGFLNWIRGAWWKLAVLLACGWAAVRLWQALRANWFFRQYAEDSTERTITRR